MLGALKRTRTGVTDGRGEAMQVLYGSALAHPIGVKLRIVESTRKQKRVAESMTGASPVTTILTFCVASPRQSVYSSDRACPCHAASRLNILITNSFFLNLTPMGSALAHPSGCTSVRIILLSSHPMGRVCPSTA